MLWASICTPPTSECAVTKQQQQNIKSCSNGEISIQSLILVNIFQSCAAFLIFAKAGLISWKENPNQAQAHKPDTGCIMTLKLALEPVWLKMKGHCCHTFIHTQRKIKTASEKPCFWFKPT